MLPLIEAEGYSCTVSMLARLLNILVTGSWNLHPDRSGSKRVQLSGNLYAPSRKELISSS
jgi:hypothetical protein